MAPPGPKSSPLAAPTIRLKLSQLDSVQTLPHPSPGLADVRDADQIVVRGEVGSNYLDHGSAIPVQLVFGTQTERGVVFKVVHTDCCCCSCDPDYGGNSPYCRNHGYTSVDSCHRHNLPGGGPDPDQMSDEQLSEWATDRVAQIREILVLAQIGGRELAAAMAAIKQILDFTDQQQGDLVRRLVGAYAQPYSPDRALPWIETYKTKLEADRRTDNCE